MRAPPLQPWRNVRRRGRSVQAKPGHMPRIARPRARPNQALGADPARVSDFMCDGGTSHECLPGTSDLQNLQWLALMVARRGTRGLILFETALLTARHRHRRSRRHRSGCSGANKAVFGGVRSGISGIPPCGVSVAAERRWAFATTPGLRVSCRMPGRARLQARR
jgi:hypothetical protein